ncbi:hypothetical protein MACH09_46180 [Vibrio sp. MACH09]|uniref:helix-turn-helix domain-containing protein n=1 Tax=Vibrio sp. MACH09 TaxID=3025122 RepID=UPI00278EBC55|nr:helix-turn-helix domain-containing protein [Vibrio sp. MACH09]GLO64110.1 hypothetical protein MACH09_46180 [Vibrio sp. MACH09]
MYIAQRKSLGVAHKPLTAYEAALIKYDCCPMERLDRWETKGVKPRLTGGFSDAFRVVLKHGARASGCLRHRAIVLGMHTFIRDIFNQNFDNLILFILKNTNTSTRTFSLRATQQQIGNVINVSQPTVSRMLGLCVQLGLLEHAFSGENDSRDPRGGLVHDKTDAQKRNLNNIYTVTDEFGPLVAGDVAGAKLNKTLQDTDKKAVDAGAGELKVRLGIVRNIAWEATIARRALSISNGTLKKKVKKETDRSRAVNIIVKRLQKRGQHIGMSEKEFSFLVNTMVSHCGFSPHVNSEEVL